MQTSDRDILTKSEKTVLKLIVLGAAKRGKARLALQESTRKLNRLTDSLEIIFKRQLALFRRNKKNPIELRQYYGEFIQTMIRVRVERAWMIAKWYIENNLEVELKLTPLDEHKIQLLTKTYVESFWKNITKRYQKEILGAGFLDAFFQILARMVTFHSVNEATVGFGMQLSVGDVLGTNQFEPTYEFVTMRDDKVDCRICAPLDGMLMKPSDLEFAQPPLHHGCRCRLLLHLEGQTLT